MAPLLSTLKHAFLSVSQINPVTPRKIAGGLNRGILMELDLRTDAQTYLGLSEKELQKSFSEFSQGVQSAMDVGTAQGFYLLYFLKKTSAKKVFSFEPDSDCRNRAIRNLALNGLYQDPRLELHDKFVGAVDNETTMTLDSFLPRIELPCIVKIDVEEAEVDVLAGAKTLLKTPGVRWILETHTADLEAKCEKILKEAGLKTTIIDKAWWRTLLPELRPRAHNRWLLAR